MPTRYRVAAILTAIAALVLLALSFVWPAKADESLTAPEPVTVDHCVTAQDVAVGMLRMKATNGGLVAIMPGKVAQAFADAWRKRTGAPPLQVSAIVMLARQAVLIAELGADGCLATLTALDGGQFKLLADALPDVVPEKPPPRVTPGI